MESETRPEPIHVCHSELLDAACRAAAGRGAVVVVLLGGTLIPCSSAGEAAKLLGIELAEAALKRINR